MNRSIALLALPMALGLSACATDGYYDGGIGYAQPYAYNGWYDGYYGPIHDGYWGRDNHFYYRIRPDDREFLRGGRDHFRRNPPPRGHGTYRELRGSFQPQEGYRMPSYPHGGRRGHRPG